MKKHSKKLISLFLSAAIVLTNMSMSMVQAVRESSEIIEANKNDCIYYWKKCDCNPTVCSFIWELWEQSDETARPPLKHLKQWLMEVPTVLARPLFAPRRSVRLMATDIGAVLARRYNRGTVESTAQDIRWSLPLTSASSPLLPWWWEYVTAYDSLQGAKAIDWYEPESLDPEQSVLREETKDWFEPESVGNEDSDGDDAEFAQAAERAGAATSGGPSEGAWHVVCNALLMCAKKIYRTCVVSPLVLICKFLRVLLQRRPNHKSVLRCQQGFCAQQDW